MNDIRKITDLARKTVELFVTENKVLEVPNDILPEYKDKRAGVFVTIYKNGNLRGCIGTIMPTEENIIKEVIRNAISSCSQDPRFTKVSPDELNSLKYSVSILMPPEPVNSLKDLDPSKYGVIVTGQYGRRGLLLPRLEGIKTVEEQVMHAMAKAGIRLGEKISLSRFESIEYKEE
ncbi:MAG: AmmeMemoRadiSam system protein A [Candidatus Sericytochromatia bacterium]|nr:MAG: AmmeMemoRadiSam system protein A [Candidatus Sericytochromatia bacterium]